MMMEKINYKKKVLNNDFSIFAKYHRDMAIYISIQVSKGPAETPTSLESKDVPFPFSIGVVSLKD